MQKGLKLFIELLKYLVFITVTSYYLFTPVTFGLIQGLITHFMIFPSPFFLSCRLPVGLPPV